MAGLDGAVTCTRCALAATRQRVVLGSGPTPARLLVVGEAPGRNEDEGGEPFIGRSGQLLTRLIAEEVGLSREEYFITNVVKCRPPNNRPPRREEITACAPWLAAQLALHVGESLLAGRDELVGRLDAGGDVVAAYAGDSNTDGTGHRRIWWDGRPRLDRKSN